LKRLAKQTTLTEEIKYEFGNIALKERFPIILAQLEAQTKVTEALKHEFDDIALRERFATVLAQLEAQTKLTESIKYDFAIELENIKYGQGENIFIRDLYAGNIKEYSAEQAYALRQAYLILYEPSSSTSESEGKGTEERLDAAIQLAMTPLRKHIGWLDEQTIGKIYEVQHEFLEIKHNNADQFRANKQDVFDLTEEARQFVKADKIALRLRLIRHSLDSNERTVTDGRT
jgi:hypothetical protein